MSEHLPPRSTPPRGKLRKFSPIDLAARTGTPVRKKGFWAGWGGIITTLLMSVTLVALLVGWVALWIDRPGGPSITLLVLGCVGFSAVIIGMATLLNRLQAHWRLRQAEALFLTGVSHNLRTPIAAIRAAAQTLGKESLQEQDKEKLISAIVHETRRLGLRVDNVLETGRLEVESKRFRDEVVPLTKIMMNALSELKNVVLVREGVLTTNIAEDVFVYGDEHSLRLMIDNLLDNALNYAKEKPDIEIRLEKRDLFAWISIRDHGLGFDPGTEEFLFKRFRRGDTGRSGTGLGLSLSRAIARGHSGELSLFSDGSDQGAIAEVWIPLHEVDL
jgi:signal transduction histidine kinase